MEKQGRPNLRNRTIATRRPSEYDSLANLSFNYGGIEPPCGTYIRHIMISSGEDREMIKRYFIGYLANVLNEIRYKKSRN
ncbi:hypothetical protein HYW74_01125 [Candidatus Pacearchaeota archaeon]|nr:hypothetical protein [Candidatus Pacearchaeota archaeon]